MRDILCEDFILGETYRAAGKRLVLSSHTVENVNEVLSLEAFLARHSRWLKMRVVIHLGSFVADIFANPVFLSAAAVLASDFDRRALAAFGLAVVLKGVGDAFLVRVCAAPPCRCASCSSRPSKTCSWASSGSTARSPAA
ncbi:MAG: hypothetical protein IPH72_17800 [Sandaracinaceae bacterium]|nr:hypothetical protein [Sandaracinaceae bacterium]